jgi:undecaprenyl diphosphate synthase
MDGNGRWGDKKKKGRNFGHLKGVETVKTIVKASMKLNVPIVTFYVFSSENWKRPKKEKNYLFKLIKRYFINEINSVIQEGIKINIFGNIQKFSPDLRSSLKRAIKFTANNKKIIVNLAINYGSKDEIIKAIKKTKNKITIKEIEKKLFTKDMPHPDILIRTGGYQRLSNFLLWQLAYAELFFLKKMWPDFNSRDLSRIIYKYKKIKRNYGNI